MATVQRQLREAEANRLSCRDSRRDPSVQECRARLEDPESGRRVDLWLAAIDGAAAVITLSGPLGAETVARWRDTLTASYGRVGVKAQGSQSMMQWVRRGRMLRLTWRREGGETLVSVSLVDGRVLDAWGARRAPASEPGR